MKRILLEVFLVAALIGASVFGFMNQKQASVSKAKITELTAAAEAQVTEAEQAAASASRERAMASEKLSESEQEIRRRVAAKFPTCAFVDLSFACDTWDAIDARCATLNAYLVPAELEK